MIKIKDNIFNEDKIVQININERNNLEIDTCNGFPIVIKDATFEDIEWNYGTTANNCKQLQKELCKSCYYRDTISNEVKELREENKKLKEENDKLKEENKQYKEYIKELKDSLMNYHIKNNKLIIYKSRIDKAIEYIEETSPFIGKETLKKILKGGE